MKFISLLIWGLLRGYAVHHIWSTTSRCEWWLNHHFFEFVCATKKSANFKNDAWRPFFNQKKLRSLQGLSTSAVVFYTKMDSDSPKHRWVKILWTHTPTGFVKLIIILDVFVALGSNSGKQPYPVCSCLKTSWSATWRTDFGPFWLWQGVPSCVESWFLQLHQPSRLYQHSSVSLAMQDTASTVEWSKATLFGRHPTATKSSAPMKNQHETFPAGCNGCSSEDAEGLFWNQSLKPASLLGKNVASLHGSLGRPNKSLLGIRWCVLPVMTGVPVGKWKPDHPIKSSFHLRRWRNQKIPWLQWWRSDNNWRRQNSLKKHLKHLEFLPNLTEKLSPWIDSCSVSVRFGSITGPWKWCNQNPWVFLLDPGSPKEGPGLWRRWGRSVFKRFPTVWQSCETPWFEVTVSDWKLTKTLAKEWGNTLQLVKLKDISFLDIQLSANWRTSIWRIPGIPFLWVLFDSRRGSTRSWNRWSKRPFSTTTRWPTNLPTIWLAFHRAALEPMSFSRSGEILVSPMILISSKRLQKTLCSDELSYRVYAVDL